MAGAGAANAMGVLVEALSNLQDVNGTTNFSLPQIVVVGNQTAGKSSVIESLVGKTFLPRGTGMKTQTPIFVRMHQSPAGSEEKVVFRPDSNNQTEMALTDLNQVRAEIEKRTERMTRNSKNINKEAIQLDFYSPDYVDLQFVDLPGFIKIPLPGQDPDIEQQILDLNIPYMRDPNTIILAIQDATQDLATSEALKHALSEDIDPDGDRTIGVLTKLDTLTSGTNRQSVAEILKNKTRPLKLGYFGVVNRTQKEIDDDRDTSGENETLKQAEFRRLKASIGIVVLRQMLVKILAEKVKKLLPNLKQDSEHELRCIEHELKQHGLNTNQDVDYDDLIVKLTQLAISKIKINLEGHDVRVDSEELNTGFTLNEMLKRGAVEASRAARQTESVEDFHRRLVENLKKVHGIRDHIFNSELVLEIGVAILTENYRQPFKDLLQETSSELNKNIIQALDATLGNYPRFKDLAQDKLLGEVEGNKGKAEEYLDVQVDIHKRFINAEHPEFGKFNQQLKKNGIRYKNKNDIWFKENIGTSAENQDDNDDEDSDIVDDVADLAGAAVPGLGLVGKAAKAVKGFVEKLQKKDDISDVDADVHTNRMPSGIKDEAMMDIDLCMNYMEIVDKALVDEVPKIFAMMLVMRTIDFLNGGKQAKAII